MNNCIGAQNRNSFIVFMISFFLLIIANIEPPITSEMLKKNNTEWKTRGLPEFYHMLCIFDLCWDDTLTVIVYVVLAMSFITTTLLIGWILILTMKKYVNDGAQIKESEGNMM